MKKRLRKKLHKGEFKEYGFAIKFHFTHQLNESEENIFFNTYIGEAVEGNDLGYFGGGDMEWEGFLSSGKRHGSVNEKQRQAVIEWVRNCSFIVEYSVGPLIDAWYEDTQF